MTRAGRWIAAAAVVSLLAGAAAVARHDAPDAVESREDVSPRADGPTPAATEELWTGTATLLDTPEAELTLCGGGMLTSEPPAGCGGPVVRNLDPMSIPGAHRYDDGTITTPSVRLVGTWDGSALTVTQPFELAERSPLPASSPIPGPSCPEPPGGWPYDRAGGWDRAYAYARAQPDAGEPRIDTTQRIMTFPFTGDVERHRAAIEKLYDGPVCVEQVGHSDRELRALFERVQADLKQRGLQMMVGFGGGSVEQYVYVSLMAISPEDKAELEAAYDSLLRIDSFLERLPRSSPAG